MNRNKKKSQLKAGKLKTGVVCCFVGALLFIVIGAVLLMKDIHTEKSKTKSETAEFETIPDEYQSKNEIDEKSIPKVSFVFDEPLDYTIDTSANTVVLQTIGLSDNAPEIASIVGENQMYAHYTIVQDTGKDCLYANCLNHYFSTKDNTTNCKSYLKKDDAWQYMDGVDMEDFMLEQGKTYEILCYAPVPVNTELSDVSFMFFDMTWDVINFYQK